MFAVLFAPNFSLQSVLRHEPELRPRPVALIDAAANLSKALVIECTASAEAAGICMGLTAPQAMARCRELVLKSRATSAEQSATEILLQTAYAFSPNIEHTAPGVCTIDLRGLSFGGQGDETHSTNAECRSGNGEGNQGLLMPAPHGDAQQNFGFSKTAATRSFSPRRDVRGSADAVLITEWAQNIITALRQLGIDAQIGMAQTPNVALLAARTAKPLLIVWEPETFFADLPLETLEPPPPLLGILKRWGLHTADALLALGRDAIGERLGAEALELFERASMDMIRPLNMVVPPDTFEEQMDFETQIETLEPLLFVLRRFVEQLAVRIGLNYRVIAELELHLTLESGVACRSAFKVPAPTANVGTLFRMLHAHLENLRTDAPIISLRLNATPARAESQQFGLFESALRDPNHFHETLARLMALLGPERVGTPVAEATHHPDSFRMLTPQFDKAEVSSPRESNDAGACRNEFVAQGLCLRRFRSGLPAEVEFEQGSPVFISTLLVSGAVKRARGPWRTSGTWWDPRRWARQEWDVEISNGEIYRLCFKDENWLVEGVYD